MLASFKGLIEIVQNNSCFIEKVFIVTEDYVYYWTIQKRLKSTESIKNQIVYKFGWHCAKSKWTLRIHNWQTRNRECKY